MAWKHLTRGEINYFVNLEKVTFLQVHDGYTSVFFAAENDERAHRIAVDQRPDQILKDEIVL